MPFQSFIRHVSMIKLPHSTSVSSSVTFEYSLRDCERQEHLTPHCLCKLASVKKLSLYVWGGCWCRSVVTDLHGGLRMFTNPDSSVCLRYVNAAVSGDKLLLYSVLPKCIQKDKSYSFWYFFNTLFKKCIILFLHLYSQPFVFPLWLL